MKADEVGSMPILVMALFALAVFGVMGVMLAVAEYSEHHKKTQTHSPKPRS